MAPPLLYKLIIRVDYNSLIFEHELLFTITHASALIDSINAWMDHNFLGGSYQILACNRISYSDIFEGF